MRNRVFYLFAGFALALALTPALPPASTAFVQYPARRIITQPSYPAGKRGDIYTDSNTGVPYHCKAATCTTGGVGWVSMDASGSGTVTGTGTSGQLAKWSSSTAIGNATAGTDYENPLTFSSPLSRATNTISCPTCGLTGSPLSQFASTTSAQLAGVVSDETGTNKLVYSDGPTLVTPVLGAATATSVTASDSGGFQLTSGGSNYKFYWLAGNGPVFQYGGVDTFGIGPNGPAVPNTKSFCLSSTTGPGATPDVCVGRNAAGVAEINNNTLGTYRDLKLRTLELTSTFTLPDGVRQTFNPNGTNAGLNVGSQAGDPGSPSNGDLWYDSTANELTARINGANVALAGAPGSVSWTALSLQNSWVNFGSGLPDASYTKINGTVHLKGMIKDGVTTGGTLLFTLPAGFRPGDTRHLGTVSNSAFGFLIINSDGTATISVGSNAWFSLSGINFPAEQ